MSRILSNPYAAENSPVKMHFVSEDVFDFKLDQTIDETVIIPEMKEALAKKKKKEIKEKKKAQQAQMRAQQGNQMGMNQTNGGMNQASGNGLMEPVMSVFDWLKLMICMSLPIVNIIVIIMAFVNKDTPKTKKNYIIAALIVMAVAVVLSLIASAIVTSMIRSAVSSLF